MAQSVTYKKGSLQVISGCMFSGKTNLLIELYKKNPNKDKCICINYILDDRYSNNNIVSHNGKKIECIFLKDLNELLFNTLYSSLLENCSHIYINEGQFFGSLLRWCIYFVEHMNKHIIVCGLDYDFKREPFGDILECEKYALIVHKMQGKCEKCDNKSLFTHRLSNSNEKILIGTKEYIPVCEKCWNILNNLS